jgi:hypothetical protein
MTEDEAKTKACCGPFAGRMAYGTADTAPEIAVQGLDPDYIAETAARWPCIGSACMAWRRRYLTERERSDLIAGQVRLGMTSDKALSFVNHLEEDAPEGFCGLAGAPA